MGKRTKLLRFMYGERPFYIVWLGMAVCYVSYLIWWGLVPESHTKWALTIFIMGPFWASTLMISRFKF